VHDYYIIVTMRKIEIAIGIFVIVLVGFYFYSTSKVEQNLRNEAGLTQTISPSDSMSTAMPTETEVVHSDAPKSEVITSGLKVPWAIAFLPARSASGIADAGGTDGAMLVTERGGSVRYVSASGELKNEPVAKLSNVKEIGEGGLLGIALHPDFESNRYVYLYYTYSGSILSVLNRVSRFVYDGSTLKNEKVIVDEIPAASNHDGGRIKFGPDKFLYITTGDAQNPSQAQDKNSLAGKILRVTDEGDPAPGNPFGNRVYSYGHRNPQGITWDKNGQLWETEHGPSGLQTGNDEFNKIQLGGNYGWPDIVGSQTEEGMISPILESGFHNTWAPSGLAYVNDKFYFSGLRGEALYRVTVSGSKATLDTFLKGEFGRLRECIVGPDGLLYLTTSNRDGRGNPVAEDDRIIRVNPNKL
jgi:glucose/arabinose dehydrogenase